MEDSYSPSTYQTKDLYEASYLYASGQKLVDLIRNGQQAWFVFEDLKGCENLSKLYWAKDGYITPKVYAEAVRSLKDYLFAER